MEDHIGYTLALLVGEDIKKDSIETQVIEEDGAIIEALQEEEIRQEEMLDESGKDSKESYMKLYSPRLQCHVCYKVMGHRSSLYKHLKYIHKIEPAHRLPISCREKDCTQSFTFIDPFRRHLAEQHGFNIVVEKYIFQNMAEFFAWKKITEQEENLRFIVSTGPRSSKTGKTHYYRCQKNGTYKPEIKKRLQSYDPQSVYNASRTHCISSMFVFEESDCVTVEFCRTHYGHEVNSEKRSKAEMEVEADSTIVDSESSLMYETVDSISKLNSYLTKTDKKALTNILNKNKNLLEDNEDLFYENEKDLMLQIPRGILQKILEDDLNEMKNEPETSEISTTVKGEELAVMNIKSETQDEEELEEDSTKVGASSTETTILKSLGNGIFLDPTSNKKIKLDTLKNRSKKIKQSSGATPAQPENKKKDRDKGTMLLREYLNEFNEKVYILEPMTYEETVVEKREKILAQLQTILMIVNNEEDLNVLDEIKKDLSKYAVPE